ncbi:MAG TPA: proprotein convertase P-domain-containing protein [Candidatus Limnocylindria bacterium]|nr:proprotein convertase P-domain-containing protein [Candidatus Limnocylindria bacterium]
MNLRPLFLTAGLLAVPLAHAGVVIVSETLSSGNAIGDAPSAGLARVLNVSTAGTVITDLSVDLDIGSLTGDTAWNGDLYAQLTGPSGSLAVLINRPGLSSSDGTGSGVAGFSITINDSAIDDIHDSPYATAGYSVNGSGQVSGTWQSDGRTDPTSSTRSKSLSQLFGQNPNGDWTLLVADLANGNRAQLNSWSITVTTAVPEPAATAAVGGLALLAAAFWLRRR